MDVMVLKTVVHRRKKSSTTVMDKELFHYIKVPDDESCPEEVVG